MKTITKLLTLLLFCPFITFGQEIPIEEEGWNKRISFFVGAGTSVIGNTVYELPIIDKTNNNVNVEGSDGSEDIFLTNVSISSATVNAGSDVNASATMNYSGNQLDSDLPSFKLDYYISTDCNLSSDDIFLDDDASSLGSDDPTNDETQDLTIPANTPSGSYYILFVADSDDELNESNENNNIECMQITIDSNLAVVDFEFQKQVTVYPSPTSNIINLKFKNNLNINNLIVFDLNGRLIKAKQADNLNNINISELTSGIYILHVIDDKNKKAIFRVVKE